MLKLSIIIPVYNAEKTIDKCVGSIFKQGLKADEFEVILINDGSKDGSLEKCKEWAMRKPQIKVIDQENSGVSKTRNKGIDLAKGEWVAFLDADDYLLENGYKIAFSPYADRKDTEIIHFLSSYDFWTIKPIISGIRYEGNTYDIIKTQQVGLPSFCWIYIYRREFLNSKGLRFKHYIVGEDQLFISSVFLENPYIIAVKADIYRYVVIENSATTKRDIMHSRRAVKDYIAAYKDILDYGAKTGANKDRPLWQVCLKSLNSKKVFGVSRIMSASYSYREYEEIRKLAKNVGFYPVLNVSKSFKSKIQTSVMNLLMRNYFVYIIISSFFNKFFVPYIMPRLRVNL